VQAEHEAPLQLAFSQENQDSEDFSTPNCQYTAVPKKYIWSMLNKEAEFTSWKRQIQELINQIESNNAQN